MRVAVILLCALVFAVPARAQTLEEQVRLMQAQIQALQAEVESLKQELHPPQADNPADILPLLQAQVAEHAQTKVESTNRFPMKIFGTIMSNTFWNSGAPDWLDIPNIATSGPKGSFSSILRQTRIGVSMDGPTLGSMKSSAVLSMDFFGGVSNFATGQTMGIPRLLYANVRLDGERTAIQIGQDQMILAPKNPTSLASLSFPSLFRSGNLYLRAPQIRIERLVRSTSRSEVRAVAGILAPIAGDAAAASFQFAPSNLAGEHSQTPGFQGRLSWKAKSGVDEKSAWELGASSHYSRPRYVSGTLSSWAGSTDFDATRNFFGIGGELFFGQNLAAFGGSVGQIAKSAGGFAEVRFAVFRKLSLNTGYGSDKLVDRARFSPAIQSNAGLFGNAIYQFTPEIVGGIEYRHQRTNTGPKDQQTNHHVDLTFAYSF